MLRLISLLPSSFAPHPPSPKPSPAAAGGGISSSASLQRKFLALRRLRGGGRARRRSCCPACMPLARAGPLPLISAFGLWFLRLWGSVGFGRLLWAGVFVPASASSRRVPAGPREVCIVVPCRLPPLRARARCARAPLFLGSLVCRGWCASSPLPPAPPSRVGGGLAVLCSRGGSPVGICSPLMPSRGVVAAAGNRRRATTCGGRPWLRGAWSAPRGLAPPHPLCPLFVLGLFLKYGGRRRYKIVKIFNRLLKICIFAPGTSDA